MFHKGLRFHGLPTEIWVKITEYVKSSNARVLYNVSRDMGELVVSCEFLFSSVDEPATRRYIPERVCRAAQELCESQIF